MVTRPTPKPSKSGRTPRGPQGYGMSSGSGSKRVDVKVGEAKGGRKYVSGSTKTGNMEKLMKTAMKSKAAGTKGKKFGGIDYDGDSKSSTGTSAQKVSKSKKK